MAARQIVSLAFVAAICSLVYGDKTCYNCGHRTLPDGTTEKLPDLPLCGDFATSEDNTKTCGNGDDCCASVEALFTTEDESTGEKSTVVIGRHGCESDLSHIGEVGVLCSEHTDECVNVEHASLPNMQDHNVTITDMEICFCSGDRCNVEDPQHQSQQSPKNLQSLQDQQ
eukprot:TRINITY_DN3388_c0_g1_i6.p1 TRINITY_DN3388_c0_g1~~TRINITY_DN3388_c0_g1_i6.p1  ORF type:complete len:190 (-),score=43.70 TRINITY_DN3388_c0_g1_i6:132-641(-)